MFVAVRNSGSRLVRSFTLIQTQAAGYDECDDPGQCKPGRTRRKRVEDFINTVCHVRKNKQICYKRPGKNHCFSSVHPERLMLVLIL